MLSRGEVVLDRDDRGLDRGLGRDLDRGCIKAYLDVHGGRDGGDVRTHGHVAGRERAVNLSKKKGSDTEGVGHRTKGVRHRQWLQKQKGSDTGGRQWLHEHERRAPKKVKHAAALDKSG